MHVDQPLRSGALVKVIDVLRDEQQLACPLGIQLRQSAMRGVRLDGAQLGPTGIIEGMYQRRVTRERLRGRHVFDAVPFPEAVRTTERRYATLR
jgi:hypothetical protein